MDKIKKVNIPVVCIKDLYKSTHQKNIFVYGHSYNISGEDDRFYYIMFDSVSDSINFAKEKLTPYYYFQDYFKK